MYIVHIYESSLQNSFEISFDLVEYSVFYLLWVITNFVIMNTICISRSINPVLLNSGRFPTFLKMTLFSTSTAIIITSM
jgi:hypothetical protein